MKTNTYLRLSLLIPLLVWGVLFVAVLIAGALSLSGFAPDEMVSLVAGVLLFPMFYVFGILVWFAPYVLLALILFSWSFIGQPRTVLRIFGLSPFAMTLLTIAAWNIMMLGTDLQSAFFTSPRVLLQYILILNIVCVVFTLVWGYICVGLGYGIYKFLQHWGWIRDDEQKHVPVALHAAL